MRACITACQARRSARLTCSHTKSLELVDGCEVILHLLHLPEVIGVHTCQLRLGKPVVSCAEERQPSQSSTPSSRALSG